MSPDKQRIAIATACGWKRHVDGLGYYQGVHPALMVGRAIPDYLNDLNAMHKAEKILDYNQLRDMEDSVSFRFAVLPFHATAAQRAEAFLLTIGKWEGAK